MENKTIAGSLYLSLNLLGLLLYVFVYYYLITNRKECKKAFYKLLIQLSVSDCGLLALNVFYGSPSTLLGYQIYGDTAGFYIANTNTIFFYAGMMTTLLISLHRLAVVVPLRMLIDKIFASWSLYGIMSCCWLIGLAMTIITNALNCPKLYNEKIFVFGYFCHNQTTEIVNATFNAMMILNLSSAALMAICYVATFGVLVSRRQQITDSETQKRRIKSERRLLYQSFIIWLILTYEICSFLTIPRFVPNFGGTLITGLGGILNSSINPILCLLFHKDIRQSSFRLITCRKPNDNARVAPASFFVSRAAMNTAIN